MMVKVEAVAPLPAVMLVRFLERRGAGSAPHMRDTLLGHLCAVHGRLVEWQSPAWLTAAGLLHSYYGSDRLDYALGDAADRPVLQRLLGPRAEELVWLYGACDFAFLVAAVARDGVPVYRDHRTGEVRDLPAPVLLPLCELMVANEVDLATHRPAYRHKKREQFAQIAARWTALLTPAAMAAVGSVLAMPADAPQA
jgi:hypothetical protein